MSTTAGGQAQPTRSGQPLQPARNWLPGWRRGCLALVALVLSLLSLTGCSPLTLRQPPQPPLTATTTGAGNHVTATRVDSDALVTITSASGIGSAELTWPAHNPPATLTLQLHLAALEELTLASPANTITINVLSRPPYTVHQTVAPAAGQPVVPIAPASPYWAHVTTVPAGAPLPLANGYFVVQAPSLLLRSARGQLTVRWIDFYR